MPTRLETPNYYSQMIAAVREWVEHEHPESDYATVIVELGDDLPAVQVPVIQRAYLSS